MDTELPRRSNARPNQNNRSNLTNIVTDGPSSSSTQTPTLSKFEIVHKAIMAPFNHKKNDSARILSDLAPVIMTPRMINSAATVSSRPRTSLAASSIQGGKLGFSTLGRAPLRLSLGSKRITSSDLQIFEDMEELLEADVPEPEGVASNVSLLRGFNATIPSAEQSRTRRRQMRNIDTPKLGLKRIGLGARGLLTEEEEESQSVASEEDVVLVKQTHGRKKKGRESLSAAKMLGKEELTRQTQEVLTDKENVHVKRSLINSEIEEITHKIQALDGIRAKLEQDLLKLQEDELELDDELEGIKERLRFEESTSGTSSTDVKNLHLPSSSRRRKGPAFLPSEHDGLPPGVAFMSLDSHTTPITALDFSEPYGTLVSASQDDAQPRVWDLLSGEEIGRLRGHVGAVRCLQVENNICLTGGVDGNVRMWDLRKVDVDDGWDEGEMVTLSDVAEEDEGQAEGNNQQASSIRDSEDKFEDKNTTCTRLLDGHTQAVTALYFEDECLVTGASDKTLRQWDLTTGQCVMTMDILWAISHPSNGAAANPMGSQIFPGSFSVPTPPYADGTRETYEDFVGGVQFWGYGLVSGSGDGAVRMWDMRTGQAHRTLLGHTGPVTCLQFDELHIASGSLDKSLKVWDLRTGSIFETIQFDHAVTALQFDTRKIIAATGENGIKVYNRTSQQKSTMLTNGHTRPVERLRYMDRYMITGGRDAQLKIWSL
ncbi:Trp-Asp repeat-containing protein [Panaeolus papilionaceus]|nr:Trp-Asp repeat-containing protein [Panaeolus papilionaceus]